MIDYREQLDSLMKLKWPALSCESVPWALHTPLCNLLGCSPVGPPPNEASSLSVIDVEKVPQPTDVVEQSDTSKEELENTREDGELPSLAPVSSNDIILAPSQESNKDHSRQLALISKSIISPMGKAKSQSFKKHEEDANLMLGLESDMDEPAYIEPEEEPIQYSEVARKWVHYGVREFSLVFVRNIDMHKKSFKLDAKVANNYHII